MKKITQRKPKIVAGAPDGNQPTSHLSLNLLREFFDQIAEGRKVNEYRDNTAYWRTRLTGREYDEIHFRNGYATRAPFMRVQCKGIRKRGKGRSSQFVIRLGRVLELRNYRGRKA
jgi:hypothetical protein